MDGVPIYKNPNTQTSSSSYMSFQLQPSLFPTTKEEDDDGDDIHESLSESPPLPLPMETIITSSPNINTNNTINNTNTTNNISLVSVAFLAALTTGGSVYSFGIYGETLKQSLQLSQSQLDTISSSIFFAGFFSWIPGLAVDKYGVKRGLISGGTLSCGSLLLYWTVSKELCFTIEGNNVVFLLSLLSILTTICLSMITGSVFKIIVTVCTNPGNKGVAVGAAKGYVGLGAGTYAVLFESIRGYNGDDLDFLMICALFTFMATVVPASCLIRGGNTNERMGGGMYLDGLTKRHFWVVYLGLVVLAVVVVGNSLLELIRDEYESKKKKNDGDDDDGDGRNYAMFVFIVIVWFGPILSMLCIAPKSQPLHDGEEEQQDEEGEMICETDKSYQEELPSYQIPTTMTDEQSSTLLLHRNNDIDQSPSNNNLMEPFIIDGTTPSSFPSYGQDFTLLQMLQTLPALLLLYTFAVLVGSGTLLTNNMGEMVQALHMHPDMAPASLSLFSVAQAFSRVVTGALSESALTWNFHSCFCRARQDGGIPRPLFLILASVLTCVSHLVLAFATNPIPFVLGVSLSGFAFGMSWPLLVLIIGEIFGAKHVGANYMFYDGVAAALGTLVLSKFVAQAVYNHHIQDEDEDKDDGGNNHKNACFGIRCFQMSHILVSLFSLSCVISSWGTLCQTRRVYRDLYHRHRRNNNTD